MPINRSDRNSTRPAPEVIEFYTQFAEESRLGAGSARLEYERTRELLERLLPPPPGRIVDVGGGAGAYAFWLADRGYQIDLVDATPRLVEEARRRDVVASWRRRSESRPVRRSESEPLEGGSFYALLL